MQAFCASMLLHIFTISQKWVCMKRALVYLPRAIVHSLYIELLSSIRKEETTLFFPRMAQLKTL